MAGKGDKMRQGANLRAYEENYDRIFTKRTVREWEKHLDHKIISYDGFRDVKETDKISYARYIDGYIHCTVLLKINESTTN